MTYGFRLCSPWDFLGHGLHVFPLYARLGLVAVPVQALVDLGFMALITVVVSGSLNFGYAGTIAMVFALLHLDAYRNNRKFVRNFP